MYKLLILILLVVLTGCLPNRPNKPEHVQAWETDRAPSAHVVSYDLPGCSRIQESRKSGIPTNLTWLAVRGLQVDLVYAGVHVPPGLGHPTGDSVERMRLYGVTTQPEDPPNTLYLVKDAQPRLLYVYRDPTWFKGIAPAGCLPKVRPSG
ncbi:MAG: hypothetical protein ACR2PL_19170 [Dehalococcoidia bacterium]